jgi:hypothetical protein
VTQQLPEKLRQVVEESVPQRATTIPFHTEDGRLVFLKMKKAA